MADFPSWSWAGWDGGKAEYAADMLDGALSNVQEWLRHHTWILWYLRDFEGNLRPLWDRDILNEDQSGERRWGGYAGRNMQPNQVRIAEHDSDMYVPAGRDHTRHDMREPWKPHRSMSDFTRRSNKAYLSQLREGYYDEDRVRAGTQNSRQTSGRSQTRELFTSTRAAEAFGTRHQRGLAERDTFRAGNTEYPGPPPIMPESPYRPGYSSEEGPVPPYAQSNLSDTDSERRLRQQYQSWMETGRDVPVPLTSNALHADRILVGSWHRQMSGPPTPGPGPSMPGPHRPGPQQPTRPHTPYIEEEDYRIYEVESEKSTVLGDDNCHYRREDEPYVPAYQPQRPSDFKDVYGRPIRDAIKGRNNTDFTGILPDNPFGIISAPFPRDKQDHAGSMPILQFWTWWAKLTITMRPGDHEDEQPLDNTSPDALVMCDLSDEAGDWCGAIRISRAWLRANGGGGMDAPSAVPLIALSDAKTFTAEECRLWNYYIPKERAESEWDLYYVMLLQRNTERALWERVAVGKVFQAAFGEAEWQEIKLG